jgi:hypothetical protein
MGGVMTNWSSISFWPMMGRLVPTNRYCADKKKSAFKLNVPEPL